MNNSRAKHRRSTLFSLRPESVAQSSQPVDYEQYFVSQLPVLERVVAEVCRRHHLRESEAEEFDAEVKVRVIDRDYQVLRQFQGHSSLHTYLTVVVSRLFLNYRNRLWGRWRPSAEAVRIGAVAILLERLIARDGWGFQEAQEQMRFNHGVKQSRDELYDLWSRLAAVSSTRHFVAPESADDVPSPEPGPGASLGRADCEFTRHRVRVALDRARQELTAEEQLMLKMRFDGGFTVREIADALHLKQKPQYRRFEKLFEQLKQRLLTFGISQEDIDDLFADIDRDSGGNHG